MSPPPLINFLLVDDREENLLSLEALLRRDGLRCLKARSGPEALELLLEWDVALALMDVQMPGMDGFELAELMRGNSRTGAVPIIFLTAGAADSQRRFRGYQAGAVDFINKPIEADILRSKAEVFFQLKHQKNLLAQQRDELRAKAEENERLLAETRQYAEALTEADRRKDEFLATLAHELRNPLAPIVNGLQILRSFPDSAESQDIPEILDRQLGHLTRLIDDLFDVSRISRGRIELRLKRIQIQEALQAALEASRPLIEERGHSLEVDTASEPIWVQADLTRLAQILSNLLNNAAKYTPRGGSISVRAERRGDSAAVSVADTGVGIAHDKLERIFELFTQVNPESETTQGGLGIGLALVQSLVALHGGAIDVSSDGPGAGSVFTVTLPIAAENASEEPREKRPKRARRPKQARAKAEPPAEAAAVAPSSEPPSPESASDAASGLSILIVDDNVASAKTMGWMLNLGGHRCELAHTGREALEKAASLSPDVVLLDIGLPDTTGYAVCEELRANPNLASTLVIAQTGWGQQRDIERARDAGFDHHLVKPVDPEQLNALLASAPRKALSP